MNKKAINPIVATMLLITLGLVIALFIFTWARSSIVALGPAQHSCNDFEFTAGIFQDNGDYFLDIINRGNIALQGFEIKTIDPNSGTVKILETQEIIIKKSQSKTMKLISKLSLGDELLIIPITLSETLEGDSLYTCDDEYGVSITL